MLQPEHSREGRLDHLAIPCKVFAMDLTSPEALAAIVELAPVSLIVADREGRIVAWNHASEALFGFPASEVKGQSLDVIIP